MKKSLVITLALVFVLGIAGTAFANPYSDVPAGHWAYKAVNDLQKAGVMEGAGGKFMGNQTLTRYEIAAIVARAMAKADKADAATKATIDKLAVEFSKELNDLGVRVAKLEKNTSSFKLSGILTQRYSITDYKNDLAPTQTSSGYTWGTANAQYRLRLDGTAKVDENTNFGMRFVLRTPDKGSFGNDTWQTFGSGTTDGLTNNIDRVFFTTKIGEIGATVGRQSIAVDSQNIVMDSGAFSFDGVKATAKVSDIALTAQYGRFIKGATYANTDLNGKAAVTAKAAVYAPVYDAAGNAVLNTDGSQKVVVVTPAVTAAAASLTDATQLDIRSIAASQKFGDATVTLGYSLFENAQKNIDVMKIVTGNVVYNFTDKLSLNALYIKNDGVQLVKGAGDDAYAAKVVYGDQVLNKEGANNFAFQYVDKKANAFINAFTALDSSAGRTLELNADFKLYNVQYNYAFSKNFNVTLSYTEVKADEGTLNSKNVKADNTVSRIVANVLF